METDIDYDWLIEEEVMDFIKWFEEEKVIMDGEDSSRLE